MGKKKEKNDIWNIERSEFLDDAINRAEEGLDLAKDDDQEEFINRIKTILACFNVRLSDVITHGIRVKNAPARGGRGDKKKHGIIAAIKKVMKKTVIKDAFSYWCHFARNHYGYKNALVVGGYKIFFQVDVNDIPEDKLSAKDTFKRGKLFEIFRDNEKNLEGIKLSTFRTYVGKIKKDSH